MWAAGDLIPGSVEVFDYSGLGCCEADLFDFEWHVEGWWV
jgi:hypothetical protein